MNSENNQVKMQKLTIEFELTGEAEEFDKCHELSDIFISLVTGLMWQRNPSFRTVKCMKVKSSLQQPKTHADVELPNLNGAAKQRRAS